MISMTKQRNREEKETMIIVKFRVIGQTKEVWECTQKLALLKQLQTHFKAKHEKGVEMPFPPHYTPG